jgi:hypothetical protein
MIVQVELKRNSDHEEFYNGSRRSQFFFGAPGSSLGTLGISGGPPNPLKAKIKLTTTVGTSKDLVESRLSRLSEGRLAEV